MESIVSYRRRLDYMNSNALDHDQDQAGGGGRDVHHSALMPQQPETPKEPIEFLSRSWSLSATEISKALVSATTKHNQLHMRHSPPPPSNSVLLSAIPETPLVPHHVPDKVVKQPANGKTRAGRAIRRLFHHKGCSDRNRIFSSSTTVSVMRKNNKDKARIENARTHAVLSVAGLAAALSAAVAASTENSTSSSTSKMNMAMASATQLLATYCIELAESRGADCQSVASVVRSALGIRGASDLLTLTAAAATALRGEAALRARLPHKEAKLSAAVCPYERERSAASGAHSPTSFHTVIKEEDQDNPCTACVGDLLQLTQKGALRWKHVSVYISKSCQVTIKLKSKHIVGGAFSKNNKSTVYEVIDDESGRWPFENKERENMQVYFGMKTGLGLLEFKCKNQVQKQKWVQGIQKLLQLELDLQVDLKRLTTTPKLKNVEDEGDLNWHGGGSC